MSTIKFKGSDIETSGVLPALGADAPSFELIKADLSKATLADFAGKKVILNIFPSIDTGICATSVRHFNQSASELDNTVVLCISRDLPFAMSRFCGAEGLSNVVTLSDFATGSFGDNYGLTMSTGPLAHLHSRAVIVLDETGKVTYTEQVPEITQEPNYDAALASL